MIYSFNDIFGYGIGHSNLLSDITGKDCVALISKNAFPTAILGVSIILSSIYFTSKVSCFSSSVTGINFKTNLCFYS